MRFGRSGTNWEGRRWIVNAAIASLCDVVEAAWPEPHGADGTVASKIHDETNPGSDHRPYPYSGSGVVCAVDVGEVTEDDGITLAEELRRARDPRLRYLIHETRMFSSYSTSVRDPWAWGTYSGPNPHTSHVHVSVWRTAGPGEWAITLDDMPEGFLPLALGDGSGARAHKASDVAAMQAIMNRSFGTVLTTDGKYGVATAAAVALHLPDPNADAGGTPGRVVTGNRWDDLLWALAVKASQASSAPGTHSHPHSHPFSGSTGSGG